jgi:hypothetical protein
VRRVRKMGRKPGEGGLHQRAAMAVALGPNPVSGGISGTRGWTNCRGGGEGGWGCPNFDQSHVG